MQRWFNDHLFELLQEMEYQQVAEVEELSDEESTSKEPSDGETNEDVEGEEAPESDLEVLVLSGFVSAWEYHETKAESCTKPTRYSRGWHRGPEVPEEGDGGDMNRNYKYHKGTEVKR
ncbi:hypothetical protein EDC04DRAFT_2607887 [Pisolithus marmoratus]|nr:hypothetical protein EDC04DRAFT_2607887 [Pisolithus marmoratus]